MSDSAQKRINRRAYQCRYSGVGIEYYPVGTVLDHAGLLIHEIGYEAQNETRCFLMYLNSPISGILAMIIIKQKQPRMPLSIVISDIYEHKGRMITIVKMP